MKTENLIKTRKELKFVYNHSSSLLAAGRRAALVLALGLAIAGGTAAQNRPAGAVRQGQDTANARIEEQLVAMALNGPRYQAALHQGKINEYQLKAAQNNWVNLLTFSYNYNDQTFAQDRAGQPNIYPKFFLGITVPLGTLLSRTNVKAAREGVEISKVNLEEIRRAVRADVLGKYRQYKSYNDLIILQRELVDDVQAALLQTEEKFRKGTVGVESFNSAQRAKNEETSKLINLQLQQDLIKLDIEEMIGTTLESVTG